MYVAHVPYIADLGHMLSFWCIPFLKYIYKIFVVVTFAIYGANNS